MDSALRDRLRDSVRGEVLAPGDQGYDEARAVWNGRFDRRPGAIARCLDEADVAAAVRLARENRLLLSIRSGGHDYAGNSVCEGGLVIDLSSMNAVQIELASRSARVQPGATWGAFDRETQAFGLATTGGTVSSVGVGGLTLGGGSGYLARKHGLTLDNLLSAEVVTARGERVRASEKENPDLFWALRGGGGNFGIVTSFELQLHPVGPEVLAGQIIYPFEAAGNVLAGYRAFISEAPDEVQCYPFIIRLPPLPVFPSEHHGKIALDLVVAYAGDLAEGERVLAPLHELGTPILDAVERQPYTTLQQTFDDGTPKGNRWYSAGHYLSGLPDEAIETVLSHTSSLPGSFTMVYFEPMGGAINRVDPEATAFPHRDAAYSIHIFPGWSDPAEDSDHIGWAREFHQAMAAYSTGGVYVNLLSPEQAGGVRSAYRRNYDRLAKIKAEWDPDNLFRMNHNIAPQV